MTLIQRLKELRQNESGNALIVFATALPLIIGSAAAAVDSVQLTVAKRQLQRSADSAALAGAYALVQSKNVSTAATRDLTLNDDGLSATPTIENAPSAGTFAGNADAVRVVLTTQRSAPFMSFFMGSARTVRAEATAAMIREGQYCAVSLEDEAVTGITMGGNATVNLGCGMITNSRSSQAAYAFGSASVNASPMAAVGAIPETNNYSSSTIFQPYSAKQLDPYSALPTPTVPSSCEDKIDVQPSEAYTIPTKSGGIYCFRGMDIKGDLNLPSGIYYIDGSTVSFGSQSVITGNDVTFILTSTTAAGNANSIADLDVGAGATVKLTATKTGTYAGVLFYQDRRAAFGTTKMNGNADSVIRGSFYFPSRNLEFTGTAGMTTRCIQLVARRIEFKGNAAIQNTCDPADGSQAFAARRIRLVA